MGVWAFPVALLVLLVLFFVWFAWADARQPAKVQQRLPGWVVSRLFDNSRGGSYPRLQKQIGVPRMSYWSALFSPKFNAVLAVGPEGMQLSFGARKPFLTLERTDITDIKLSSRNALIAMPVFSLRSRRGDTQIFCTQFLRTFLRGLHRDEGVALVQAMREAAQLPTLPDQQLFVTVEGDAWLNA